MWRPFIAAGLSLGLIVHTSAQLTPDDEIVSVKEIPISSLRLVERADGNVFFISENKRFAVVGEIYDLWTGKNVLDVDHFNQLDWERSGVEMQQIILENDTSSQPDAVLFVTQGCTECGDISKLVRGVIDPAVAVVPLNQEKEIGVLPEIWCDTEVTLAILTEWLQTNSQLGVSEGCESLAGARAHAFADVYDIPRDTPVLVDSTGRIHTGKEDIQKWLRQ